MANIHAILEKYWGYSSFRPLQEDIINTVLQKKDVLALLPTGGGKSLCFQVPALAMGGICIVISPLIALIKDQVYQLTKRGIPALALYSGMGYHEVKKTLQNAAFGNYQFLYLSPERLETRLFLEYLPAIKPSLIAVDEAHCISQWGYDFRPPYLRINDLRAELPGVPLIALTASATPDVQNDICQKLNFDKHAKQFQQAFDRPNLSYSVFSPAAKETKLREILANVPGSAIVYCSSRKHTQQVAGLLKLNGIHADHYHAGLPSEERSAKQDAWIKNKTRVIVCTNAFGMGIDKPDVRVVVHYDIPDCIENYYQEAGRAGRDGKKAYAVLLYQPHEIEAIKGLINIRYPSPVQIKKVYAAVMNHLQVPAGIGEGRSFDFDLAVFAQHFKLNILEATYGIQALAQQEILSFNEVFYRASTAVFTADKEQLADFEKMHPHLEPTVKALLRSYEGIFDFPVQIYEGLLANFLRIPKVDVVHNLKTLQHYQIIEYTPATEKPQLYLIKNRMYNDDFKIDAKGIALRKKKHEERVDAMEAYVAETALCRSSMLSGYFGATANKTCGICDNCLKQAEASLDAEAFENLYKQILKHTAAGAISIATLVNRLKPAREAHIWQAINFLESEEKIYHEDVGIIRLKV